MITKQNDILKELRSFYKKFYSSRDRNNNDNLPNILQNCSFKKLSDLEALELEGEITYTEALEFLKTMKNNKSPGSDGYSAEFFKFFWKNIGFF